MGHLQRRQFDLHGLLLFGVRLHERQADVTLRHDHGKLCLGLQRLASGTPQVQVRSQFFVQDRHGLTHVVAAGGQCPAEYVPF